MCGLSEHFLMMILFSCLTIHKNVIISQCLLSILYAWYFFFKISNGELTTMAYHNTAGTEFLKYLLISESRNSVTTLFLSTNQSVSLPSAPSERKKCNLSFLIIQWETQYIVHLVKKHTLRISDFWHLSQTSVIISNFPLKCQNNF